MLFNFTNSSNNPKNQFEKMQHGLLSLFLKGEDLMHRFAHERNKIDQTQEEYNNFLEKNTNEDIVDNSVVNIAREKRLKMRLWFTIIVEAILSLSAIKFFLAEMLNIPLQWPPAVVLGIFLTAIILEWAIDVRIDDNQDEELDNNTNGQFKATVKKMSYIISLMLIPAINFFIIITTPGNYLNILYAFFAVFSILLNLKTASYWRQYRLLKHSAIAKSRIKNYKNTIKKGEKILYDLTVKMKSLKDKITSESMKLRHVYENFRTEDKPSFILPVKYLFVLNNLIFHSDVFLIPQLQLTFPPAGDMNDDLEAWGDLILTHPVPPKPPVKAARKIPNSPQIQDNLYESEINNSVNENNHPIDGTSENTNNEDSTNTNMADSGNSENTILDPGAESGIPDNEKYV